MMKLIFVTLNFFLFTICCYSQASGTVELGSEITNGVMTDGCVASCQPTYCTNQSDNAGNHPVETIVLTITGIPAGESAEITITSILCGSTSGLDGGDDIFIDGTQVFDGGSNAEVNITECVAGGADIVIEFTVNRRDEIIEVSWISGPSSADPSMCIDQVVDVDYADFSASPLNESIELEWTTLKETQNDYFEVQKSADGRVYKAVGTVLGKGNSDNTVDYQFTDDNPMSGTNYYRLKQVDFNGVYRLSETITVNYDKQDVQFSIRPSIVSERLIISHPKNSIVRIVNMQSQLIDEFQVNQYTEYDVSTLPNGIYIISTFINGKAVSKRFVKT